MNRRWNRDLWDGILLWLVGLFVVLVVLLFGLQWFLCRRRVLEIYVADFSLRYRVLWMGIILRFGSI